MTVFIVDEQTRLVEGVDSFMTLSRDNSGFKDVELRWSAHHNGSYDRRRELAGTVNRLTNKGKHLENSYSDRARTHVLRSATVCGQWGPS